MLPSGTQLEDLNNSFISGDNHHGYQHNVSQIRVKQLKSSQNTRLSKAAPLSSVQMAKDIYRKGNAVS